MTKMLTETAKNLRKTLVYRNGLFPLGCYLSASSTPGTSEPV